MPFAGYKDFSACVSAQRRKGKSPESAKKICGALQARVEGTATKNAAAQVPQDFRPHYDRSEKALDFLREQGIIVDNDEVTPFGDTSLVNQLTNQNLMSSSDNIIFSDPEPYADKVTRIMDEYDLDEEQAKVVVNKMIEDDMKELERREYEITKQLQIERAQADLITSGEAAEPTIQKESDGDQQQDVNTGNDTDRIGETNAE